MLKRIKPNYSEEEVEVLINDYAELMYVRHKEWIQTRLMDIALAFRSMPKVYKEALFWHGCMEYPTSDAAKIIGVSRDTIYRRYSKGLIWLLARLNGRLM